MQEACRIVTICTVPVMSVLKYCRRGPDLPPRTDRAIRDSMTWVRFDFPEKIAENPSSERVHTNRKDTYPYDQGRGSLTGATRISSEVFCDGGEDVSVTTDDTLLNQPDLGVFFSVNNVKFQTIEAFTVRSKRLLGLSQRWNRSRRWKVILQLRNWQRNR